MKNIPIPRVPAPQAVRNTQRLQPRVQFQRVRARENAPVNLRPRGATDNGRQPKTAWVVAAPKSGSTWISAMISALLDWPTLAIIMRSGREAQIPHVGPRFLNHNGNLFIPHTHAMGHETAIDFVRRYDVRVIIPVRDIMDSLTSLHDHLVDLGVNLLVGHIPLSYKTDTPERQKQILIHFALPWYINFYASWEEAGAIYGIKPLFVPYSDLLTDPRACMEQVLRHTGEKRTAAQVDEAIAYSQQTGTRFNMGIEGRGKTFFNDEEQGEIDALLSIHSDTLICKAISRIWTSKTKSTPQEASQLQPSEANAI